MMWPFRHKRPEVELTNKVFAQWLRAQRPPWEWFLSQPPMIQETLAVEGDDYIRHCVSLGDVEGEVAVMESESEQQAAQRIGAEAYQRLAGGQKGTPTPIPAPQPLTMAGLGKRRQETTEAGQVDKPTKRLFGRAPDSERARGPCAEDYQGTQPKEESQPGYDGMGGLPEPGDGRETG